MLKLLLNMNTSLEALECVVEQALKRCDLYTKYPLTGFQLRKQESFEEVYQADA